VTVVVAGEAGQGVKSASNALARCFARSGFHVFAYPDVMSRIRGGHNFTRVRVSDSPVRSISNRFNVLLALDQRSVDEHQDQMVERGVIVVDGRAAPSWRRQARLIPLPLTELAKRHGGGPALAGVAGLGAIHALLGLGLGGMERLLKELFAGKGKDVVRQNINCLRAGHKAVPERASAECPCVLPAKTNVRKRMLLTGNQAVAFGALAGGVRFYAGYPMSPATPIMEYLAARQEDFGLVVEQTEDEISAINTAIGASYAGARSMTATSGGGFSLMVEGLGLAAMSENPVVIVVCQRPGPATGFPTRTEQAELLMCVSASQDEFPRFIFAPGNAEQAFHCTHRAFELASRFQVPAIVLSDQQLADSLYTVDRLDPDRVSAADGFADREWQNRPAYTYRRYLVTEDGVSPRLRPGFTEQLVCCMGSEHDESGLSTEDAANRVRMHDKRMRKTAEMGEEFGEHTAYPGEREDSVVVCFGSTYGAVRDAVELVQADGNRVGMLHLSEVWPFPSQTVVARLARARQVIVVEQNSTGQLARLMTRMTRIRPNELILKYDGRPFAGADLADRISDIYVGRLS
jgi:2-oxoglutarate ferredoxin oxidoreductase subunit alpha